MSQVAFIHGTDRCRNIQEVLALLPEQQWEGLSGATTVLIKPNLVHHLIQLASTHVDAVRGVIDFVRKKTEAKIIVADASYHGTKSAFKNFGYENLLHEYQNVSLLDLNDDETVEGYYVKRDGSKGKMRIAKSVVDADFTINLAGIKTHRTTGVTLSMKNWAGGIWVVEPTQGQDGPRWTREAAFHEEGRRAQEETIVGIHQQIKPNISIIDGFVAMEGNGPTKGSEVETHVALAGTDSVALDSTVCRLMRIDPEDIGCLVIAGQQGYGVLKKADIQMLGDQNIDHYQKTFLLPETWQERVLTWKD